jgi:hypothetical protein
VKSGDNFGQPVGGVQAARSSMLHDLGECCTPDEVIE